MSTESTGSIGEGPFEFNDPVQESGVPGVEENVDSQREQTLPRQESQPPPSSTVFRASTSTDYLSGHNRTNALGQRTLGRVDEKREEDVPRATEDRIDRGSQEAPDPDFDAAEALPAQESAVPTAVEGSALDEVTTPTFTRPQEIFTNDQTFELYVKFFDCHTRDRSQLLETAIQAHAEIPEKANEQMLFAYENGWISAQEFITYRLNTSGYFHMPGDRPSIPNGEVKLPENIRKAKPKQLAESLTARSNGILDRTNMGSSVSKDKAMKQMIQVSQFVTVSILDGDPLPTEKEVKKRCKYWGKVIDQLVKSGDLATAQMVYIGLNNTSITRIYSEVDTTTKHSELFDSQNNFKNIRDAAEQLSNNGQNCNPSFMVFNSEVARVFELSHVSEDTAVEVKNKSDGFNEKRSTPPAETFYDLGDMPLDVNESAVYRRSRQIMPPKFA